MDDWMRDLQAWFELSDHSIRDGLVYVSNEATIRRFNTVLGANWRLQINSTYQDHLKEHPEKTKSGKTQFYASCIVSLDVYAEGGRVSRDGYGAAVNFDPDTAVKTAQAEAMKKASNQFGVAGYLWNKENADIVAGAMRGDPGCRVEFLVNKAISYGCEMDRESIAAFYNVKPEDMTDVEVLQSLCYPGT